MTKANTIADEYHILADDMADLRATSYGFRDAADMKAWGEQAEQDRLAELASKEDTTRD